MKKAFLPPLLLALTIPPALATEEMHHHSDLPGAFGPYSMTREASGTSWQPDSASMHGFHTMLNDWMIMVHGFASGVRTDQGGPRGDDKTFGASMLMGMAYRPTPIGTFGFRTMLSGDPLTIRKKGYPLLFQTGETADGLTPLIDRQHPHDLFMELALTYGVPITDHQGLYMYFALPGEPALGPPAFMHRASGMEFPEAPITHHWIDSTHVTYGVATLGWIIDPFKLEASLFTGREPDEDRFAFDKPKFDSFSFRASLNPTPRWSLQASFGHIKSREQLEPNVDTNRCTASAIYDNSLWNSVPIETTFAWGVNIDRPGSASHAFLLESAATAWQRHTLFSRIETVQKNELFLSPDPREKDLFTVSKFSLGYKLRVFTWNHLSFGLGGVGHIHFVPSALKTDYDSHPLSWSVFAKLHIET